MKDILDVYTIRNLMLEALGDESVAADLYSGYNFNRTNGGAISDLIKITEGLAIKYNLIAKQIEIPRGAWAAPGYNLFEGSNTNFKQKEIERCWEAFYMLLNNNVIAPGMYRNSDQLPFFHITTYGEECVKAREVLPYDVDGFLHRIKSIENIDEWVEFYLTDALKCFNANVFNSTVMNLGLASERLIEIIIDKTGKVIGKSSLGIGVKKKYENQFPNLDTSEKLRDKFYEKVRGPLKIATRFEKYNEYIEMFEGFPLEVTDYIEKSSRKIFADYLRLNRNEVGHPSDIRKDQTETLLLMLGFIKYCEAYSMLIKKLDENI
ncbi:MAG: hypothetical protein RBR71_07110 [Gudongella sp.]|nr:hypothetical protein [Gudongella sp.]